MQTIVTAADAAEFLALVPRLTGFSGPGSIVLVAFAGARTCGALRFDEPHAGSGPDAAVDQDHLAATMLGTLCRIPDADGIVLVAYPSESCASPQASAVSVPVGDDAPQAEFVHRLLVQASRQGFIVRDALWQTAQHWGSYLGGARQARPVDDIVAAARSMPGIDWSAQRTDPVIEPVDGQTRAAVAAVLAVLDEQPATRGSHPGRAPERGAASTDRSNQADDDESSQLERCLSAFADPIAFVEALLARPSAEVLPAELALVTLALAVPAVRDGVMMQLAFGQPFGRSVLDASIGFTEVDGQGASRSRANALLREAAARTLGESGRPDRERILRGIGLIGRVAESLDDARRAHAFAVLAWLHWAIGRGTTARAMLEHALAADPAHGLAGLLRTFLGSGRLPEWLFARP